MAFNWLESRLQKRASQGYLRQRYCQQYERDNIICINGEHYLNFASNDYLGMRQHEGLLQSWVEGLAQFGGGSGASPLVTGHTQAHLALEAYIADGLNRDAALLFNSGFAANQALCMALFHEGGDIVADKLMHASLLEGAMATKATLRRFKHNDVAHANQIIQKAKSDDKLIVTEGIFSMDGDAAPLKALTRVAIDNNAWLMVDDAHGMGVLGEKGLGSIDAYSLSQHDVPVVMGTFGKAVGTAGAFIAGSQTLIDYLVNYAKHYVYSTAMPAAQAVATLYSLTHIANDAKPRELLQTNIAYFKQRFHAKIGNIASELQAPLLSLKSSNSAIQPVIVGSPERALALSEGLKQRGIWIPAIRYPTVPKGEDRLRITLSATHTTQDIDALIDAIQLSAEAIE